MNWEDDDIIDYDPTSDLVIDINIDDYRGPYVYQDVKEALLIATKYLHDTNRLFERLLAVTDPQEYRDLCNLYDNRNKLSGMYVCSVIAMIRRNIELGDETLRNPEKILSKFRKSNGFKFDHPDLVEALRNLKIAPVAPVTKTPGTLDERRLKLDVPDFKGFTPEIHGAGNLDPFGHNTDGFGYFY